MLHALLRAAGHPRSDFLGSCAGLVNCGDVCVRDAGQWSSPGTAVTASADSLTIGVAPQLLPTETDGQRWFELHVSAHNPTPRNVAIETIGARTFGIDLRGPTGGFATSLVATDSSALVFRPMETKSWTFDLIVADSLSQWSLPPGAYVVRGGYAEHWTAAANIDVPR